MDFISEINGKKQINKNRAFVFLIGNIGTDNMYTYSNLLDNFDKEIKVAAPFTSMGALNNSHGDWYEWILAISAYNYYCINDSSIAIPLPNVSSLNVMSLYTAEYLNMIEDFKEKIKFAEVNLISSNPDFVILKKDIASANIHKNPIEKITLETLDFIDNLYKKVEGKCELDDIIGFMSVKTSFRPDRRLQIPHEGSLFKAIYTHIQTRKWILKPQGLKYYAVAMNVGPSDEKALKTVATHSITTVHSEPQAAVDAVFQVNSESDALLLWKSIL